MARVDSLCPVGVLLFLLTASGFAADIRPARQTVPDRFINPPGKRFSIFQGDPERVQRANEVKLEDFESKLVLEPASISLPPGNPGPEAAAPQPAPSFEVQLHIRNRGRRAYTLSFPDAQRFDIMIQDAAGQPVYVWSDDKVFVQEIGSSFVNPGELLVFRETIQLTGALAQLPPGKYQVTSILSNYPELKGVAELTILPAPQNPLPAATPPQPRAAETPTSAPAAAE